MGVPNLLQHRDNFTFASAANMVKLWVATLVLAMFFLASNVQGSGEGSTCSCNGKLNENGLGECKNAFQGHLFCYVNKGDCKDQRESFSIPGWFWSYQACQKGDRPRSQRDQEVVNLKSNCHLALDACDTNATCRTYLYTVQHRCVDSCSRDRCMTAVQELYRKIQPKLSVYIGFCICKKNVEDVQCFGAQSMLHPTCAQNPAQWSQREEDLPSCHSLARECREEADCRSKLERYEQACSVDRKTKTCSGPYDACRSAMVDILGTKMRTNCACTGTTTGEGVDFRELFECIGYMRLFWVNPCVVDAQKDYNLKLVKTGSTWKPTNEDSPTLPHTSSRQVPRPKPDIPTQENYDYGSGSGDESSGSGSGDEGFGSVSGVEDYSFDSQFV